MGKIVFFLFTDRFVFKHHLNKEFQKEVEFGLICNHNIRLEYEIFSALQS